MLKCRRPTKDVGGRKSRRPDSYYLGSAESPLCLLLSPAEDLSQKVLPLLHAVPKWNLLTNPLSLYGRRLCRTGTACCTGTTCQNVRALQMSTAADILTLFSKKNQKPNSSIHFHSSLYRIKKADRIQLHHFWVSKKRPSSFLAAFPENH